MGRAVVLAGIVFLAVAIPRAGTGAGDAASRACRVSIEGRVNDAATASPIAEAIVHWDKGVALTDSIGRFRIEHLCPGELILTFHHVGHVPISHRITISAGRDTLSLSVLLAPRTHLLEEIQVRGTEVVPLTSVAHPAHIVPPSVVREFPGQTLADALQKLPGVTVSGDRPFFRGVSDEQVEPLIDGIPAREPVTGRWIIPPPQAVSDASYVSGAMLPEAQALGGVFSFHLGEGGDTRQARLSLETDRPSLGMERSRDTDVAAISASGRTRVPGLVWSGAWQMRAGNGPLSYAHGLPSQSALGLVPVPGRMQGQEAASLKLAFKRRASRWKATAALVTTRVTEKAYHENYSRFGFVGFDTLYNRYMTFEGQGFTDTLVYYDGPGAVPVARRRSTLVFTTLTRTESGRSSFRVYALYGRHRERVAAEALTAGETAAVREWLDHRTTDPRYQEEAFYSVHGDRPEFEWHASDEGGIGSDGFFRPAPAHDLRFGAAATFGHHVSMTGPIGSLERGLASLDGYAYLEDTWNSDRLSWLQGSLRFLFRRITLGRHAFFGSRVSPALAFHQPMGTADAIHVQAGSSYQFPSLLPYFEADLTGGSGLDLNAQKARFVEAGMQHHFSAAAVIYLGAYMRDDSDVIFTRHVPSELEVAFGHTEPPPQFLETRGSELVFDHRFRASLSGQSSAVWSRTTRDDIEVPWSRRLVLRNLLVWSPAPELALTLSTEWNGGRPYSICLNSKGCPADRLVTGTLPAWFENDLGCRAGTKLWGRSVRLRAEILNLADRRIPTFDFSVSPMKLSGDNFLVYYHDLGETDGYATEYGSVRTYYRRFDPETRSPGRSVLIGAEFDF